MNPRMLSASTRVLVATYVGAPLNCRHFAGISESAYGMFLSQLRFLPKKQLQCLVHSACVALNIWGLSGAIHDYPDEIDIVIRETSCIRVLSILRGEALAA